MGRAGWNSGNVGEMLGKCWRYVECAGHFRFSRPKPPSTQLIGGGMLGECRSYVECSTFPILRQAPLEILRQLG